MAKTYTLEDYEDLAYEFAIRNPRVIELLKPILTEEVAKELLEYGIDTLIEYTDDEGNLYTKYSLAELYLDYPHLGDDLKGIQISHKGKMYTTEEYRKLFPDAMEGEGDKKIVHPESYNKYFKKESDIDAIVRIEEIFPKKAGHLNRLMDGSIFEYYDEHILCKEDFNDNKIPQKKKNDVTTIRTYSKKNFYMHLIHKKLPMFKKYTKGTIHKYD